MAQTIRLNNLKRLRRHMARVKSVDKGAGTALVMLIEEDNTEVVALYKIDDSAPYNVPAESALCLLDQYQDGLFYITTTFSANQINIAAGDASLRSILLDIKDSLNDIKDKINAIQLASVTGVLTGTPPTVNFTLSFPSDASLQEPLLRIEQAIDNLFVP